MALDTRNTKVIADSLGSCFVQPPADVAPVLTLFAVETEYGLKLVDHAGVSVSPKSQRLNYSSKRGNHGGWLVVDDNLSPGVFDRLAALGFPMAEHG